MIFRLEHHFCWKCLSGCIVSVSSVCVSIPLSISIRLVQICRFWPTMKLPKMIRKNLVLPSTLLLIKMHAFFTAYPAFKGLQSLHLPALEQLLYSSTWSHGNKGLIWICQSPLYRWLIAGRPFSSWAGSLFSLQSYKCLLMLCPSKPFFHVCLQSCFFQTAAFWAVTPFGHVLQYPSEASQFLWTIGKAVRLLLWAYPGNIQNEHNTLMPTARCGTGGGPN